ncbi:hypothetical protein BLM14_07190 [Phyllobacterium zundukense]|nr:hypothetical protein BLM14_07190 [Phyllobacterium zundukense]
MRKGDLRLTGGPREREHSPSTWEELHEFSTGQRAVTFVRGSEVDVNRPPDPILNLMAVAPALLVTHARLDCQQPIKMNVRFAPIPVVDSRCNGRV